MPVQLEERFVNSTLVPDYDKQDFEAVTTYDYLQKSTPLTEIEYVIWPSPWTRRRQACCISIRRALPPSLSPHLDRQRGGDREPPHLRRQPLFARQPLRAGYHRLNAHGALQEGYHPPVRRTVK